MGLVWSKTERVLREYNELSNNGVMYDLDLSKRPDLGVREDEQHNKLVLTNDEVRERERALEIKEEINWKLRRFSFLNRRGKQIEDFLRLQVAFPVLHPDPKRASARSSIAEARADRWYPPSLSSWKNLPTLVENFHSDATLEGRSRSFASRAVEDSFTNMDELVNESNEQGYLRVTAMLGLKKAGLIGGFVEGNRGLVSNPDFWISNQNGKLVIVGEAKSTQNLPLPMDAREVVRQYNDAFASTDQDPTEAQVRAWSHVGHPVSQLVGYMILNRCRYGMLTSATRTYFVHIDTQHDGEDTVLISNAWYIGQPGYLRVIATMYELACSDNKPPLTTQNRRGWMRTTPPRMKESRSKKRAREGGDPGRRMRTRSRDRQGGESSLLGPGTGTGHAMQEAKYERSTTTVEFGTIESVDFDEVELRDPIGYGKCGTSFAAIWRDELVAIKVFDSTKPGGQEAFNKEIAAYIHLQGVWGDLVPRPRFVSSAFGARFLGMQMAHAPGDDACPQDWAGVLEKLEKNYRFRHLDVWTGERGDDWRNLMVIRDKDGVDRPIVIDLEDYEILPKRATTCM